MYNRTLVVICYFLKILIDNVIGSIDN